MCAVMMVLALTILILRRRVLLCILDAQRGDLQSLETRICAQTDGVKDIAVVFEHDDVDINDPAQPARDNAELLQIDAVAVPHDVLKLSVCGIVGNAE